MDIHAILASPETELIYRNYNSVFVHKKVIAIKHYADSWRLEKEVTINRLLRKQGFSLVQEIIDVCHPYVAFVFVNEQSFGERLCSSGISALQLVEAFRHLPRQVESLDLHHRVESTKRRMSQRANALLHQGFMDAGDISSIERLISVYSMPQRRFIHGDLRPDNILGNQSVKCFIDWECAEYGDANRDLAYLYFGTLLRNPSYSAALLKQIREQDEYSELSFAFYLAFILLNCLENPRIEQRTVLTSLTNLVKSGPLAMDWS